MIKLLKLILLALATSLLSACLGGTIAQQIARSIVTSVADKAVASSINKQEKKERDEARANEAMAFARAGFRTVDANSPAIESLPAPQEEEPVQVLQTNALVRVQLFNLLIGQEKEAIYEKARKLGALNLPNQREWARWNVATGMIENDNKLITFLIPPEFGKLPSGTLALVELAGPGDLNIARYK